MADPSVSLRPVTEDDLALLRRFLTEPGLIGLDWNGFRDARKIDRRFAADGYLTPDDTWLMVSVDDDGTAAGFDADLTYNVLRHSMVASRVLEERRDLVMAARTQPSGCAPGTS